MTAPLAYGRTYHLYNRGNNRENIFVDVRNYYHFLELYARQIAPVADTYAYCLLRNHFHLLIRTKTMNEQEAYWRNLSGAEKPLMGELHLTGSGNLTGLSNLSGFPNLPLKPSQRFSNLFNAYTKAINNAYGRTGALFNALLGRVEVTSHAHFCRLVVYIHQNPQKHGLVADFRQWPYSSYHTLLSPRKTSLHRDEVFSWFQGKTGFLSAHAQELPQQQMLALVPEEFD